MTRASKHCALAAMLILVFGGLTRGWAQTTNFSGTWMFDASKSNGSPELPSIGGSQGTAVRPAGGAAGGAPGGAGGGRQAPAGTFDPSTGSTNHIHVSSTRVSPRSSALTISGSSASKRRRSSARRVFPTRTHTTAGPSCRTWWTAKSSSFVTITAPTLTARARTSASDAFSRLQSAKCSAPWPSDSIRRASAGGS